MKKIISLFKRDYEGTRQVYDEVVEGAEWVINGEGVATRKFDGTACMVKDGVLYKRYDAKKGKKPPVNGIPCESEPNEHTGHWPFWVPITEAKEDKWFREAFIGNESDGTYELCGPKINGNPENLIEHVLIPHGLELYHCPRTYTEIREWLKNKDIEGIVWHRADGEMVKIKKKDFGLRRKD